MSSEASKHVDEVVTKLRTIFEKASLRIEEIPPGSKVPATELAATLAKEIGMTGPQLYPTLKFLFDDYPNVDIRKGAHGGIYKLLPGEKPSSKKARETAKSDVTDVPDSENE